MEGVGELFGKSVDKVLRRPRTSLVPFIVDALTLVLGTVLFFAIAAVPLLFPQGYRLPNLPVAVPHALPTVGDVMGPTPDVYAFGGEAVTAAALLVLILVPTLAFAEAGFLGVLRAVHLQKHDSLLEGRHADAWSRVREAFFETGRRRFPTFLVLRSIQAMLALAALLIPYIVLQWPLLAPWLRNYALAVFVVDVLLLYAPYAAVEHARTAFAAIRESMQLVSDHLAVTLVALLFGLLVTGGVSILLAPLAAATGIWGPFIASAFYAVPGTMLALFLYHVYLSLTSIEPLPEAMPARDALPAGG